MISFWFTSFSYLSPAHNVTFLYSSTPPSITGCSIVYTTLSHIFLTNLYHFIFFILIVSQFLSTFISPISRQRTGTDLRFFYDEWFIKDKSPQKLFLFYCFARHAFGRHDCRAYPCRIDSYLLMNNKTSFFLLINFKIVNIIQRLVNALASK